MEEASFSKNSISSLLDLPDKTLARYTFDECPIISFNGIEQLINVECFEAKDALFTSFKYATNLCNLKKINLVGSPVSLRPQFRLMTILTFGSQLEEINGKAVSDEEKKIIDTIEAKAELIQYIQNGGLIQRAIDHSFSEYAARKLSSLPTLDFEIVSPPPSLSFKSFLTAKAFEDAQKPNTQTVSSENIYIQEEYLIRSLINECYSRFGSDTVLPSYQEVYDLLNGVNDKLVNAIENYSQNNEIIQNAINNVSNLIDQTNQMNNIYETQAENMKINVEKIMKTIQSLPMHKEYMGEVYKNLSNYSKRNILEPRINFSFQSFISKYEKYISEATNFFNSMKLNDDLFHNIVNYIYDNLDQAYRENYNIIQDDIQNIYNHSFNLFNDLRSYFHDPENFIFKNIVNQIDKMITFYEQQYNEMMEIVSYLSQLKVIASLLRKLPSPNYFSTIAHYKGYFIQSSFQEDLFVKQLLEMFDVAQEIHDNYHIILEIMNNIKSSYELHSQIKVIELEEIKKIQKDFFQNVVNELENYLEDEEQSDSKIESKNKLMTTKDRITKLSEFVMKTQEWKEENKTYSLIFEELSYTGVPKINNTIISSEENIVELSFQNKQLDQMLQKLGKPTKRPKKNTEENTKTEPDVPSSEPKALSSQETKTHSKTEAVTPKPKESKDTKSTTKGKTETKKKPTQKGIKRPTVKPKK